MANRSTIANILFGGITLFSLLGLFYYFFRRNNKLSITNGPTIKKPASKTTIPSESSTKKSSTPEASHVKEDVVIEDEDGESDDEDDDEEVDEHDDNMTKDDIKTQDKPSTASTNDDIVEKARLKALELEAQEIRSEYDTAVRIARKLLDGQSYDRAAAKYTEALELANKIPTASKDILTLYNNRSAMYEKSADYQKSLNDITVVLAMDPKHIKARMRKARVLEAQGKLKEALFDYIYGMILEQANGEQPSGIAKIEEMNKIVAKHDAIKIVDMMRTSSGRSLPPKSYCRNFFESLPSIHRWRVIYQHIDRDELYSKYEMISSSSTSSMMEKLSSGLELVYFYLAHGLFTRAFDEELTRLSPIIEAIEAADHHDQALDAHIKAHLAIYHELRGTNYHLRCNLSKAIESYTVALSFDPHHYEAMLKLASVHLELGENAVAASYYTSAMNIMHHHHDHKHDNDVDHKDDDKDDDDDDVMMAWIYIHRATLWTTRNEDGKFVDDAAGKALHDIDEALRLTDKENKSAGCKAARVSALLKAIQVSTHTKAQMGEQATAEDSERNKSYIMEAKSLDPRNETVSLMEADMMSVEGDITSALDLVASITQHSDGDDGIPHVIRANILTQRAFQELQYAQMNGSAQYMQLAQATFAQASTSYEAALTVEPMCIEALTQYGQLKQMLGDPAGAVALSEKALLYGRSKDEVQELCQLNLMAHAQYAAFMDLQAVAGTA